jgi:cyanophycin synthetase
MEQGQGVEADLRNPAELRAAFPRSMAVSKNLILEKHIPGEDYRVYVVKGAVIGVAHRIAGGLVGDGVNTVSNLLAAENAIRKQFLGHDSVYKPIEWDAEATELLERQGLVMNSVPALGRRVRLRRSANSSRGGLSVDVTSTIHPDNAELCIEAATVLRLDIVGLDLLMPDIAKSWREVGAGFCEANAQPQMGGAQPWIFEKILRSFVSDHGRIPVVLVLGALHEEPLVDFLATDSKQLGKSVKIVRGSGIQLVHDGKAALINPKTEMLVLLTDGNGLAGSGLPVDRVDVLLVARSVIQLPHFLVILQMLSYLVGVGAVLDEQLLSDPNGAAFLKILKRSVSEKNVQTRDLVDMPKVIKETLMSLNRGGYS